MNKHDVMTSQTIYVKMWINKNITTVVAKSKPSKKRIRLHNQILIFVSISSYDSLAEHYVAQFDCFITNKTIDNYAICFKNLKKYISQGRTSLLATTVSIRLKIRTCPPFTKQTIFT